MDYRLNIAGGPDTVPAGTGILLLHPSTADTDRIDIQFLSEDTDRYIVISTRTTAHEVEQKLDFYDVDRDRATILDAISVERGYSRRQTDRVTYLSTPDDVDGLTEAVHEFLTSHDGKLRVSLDSITELTFYAGHERTRDAIVRLLDLLDEHGAVGIFHLATGVHDEDVIDSYRELFDLVIRLDDDASVSVLD